MSGHTTLLFIGRENSGWTDEYASVELVSPTDSEGDETESGEGLGSRVRSGDLETAGWFASSFDDLTGCTPNGISIYGSGPDAQANLSNIDVEGWSEVIPPDSPPGRHGHKMVYDSTNEKVVMFGGQTSPGSSETWLYDTSNNRWTQVFPSPSPSVRTYPGMAYDIKNDKIVLFGGYYYKDDTWTYDTVMNKWERQPLGVRPPRMYAPAMAYDPLSELVVLFGGRILPGGRLSNDTWVYDTANNDWTKRAPDTAPSPRYHHEMVYDPVTNTMIMFGGAGGGNQNDSWSYDVANDEWTKLLPSGVPGNPPRRYAHSMAYDSEVHKVVLYGGYPYDRNVWLFDTSANEWRRTNYPDRPLARSACGMAYDSTNLKTVMFGGYPSYKKDTWLYDQMRHVPQGTLSSPVITLPIGYKWDLISLDKYERPGTYLNLTVIDAITSLPVTGFDKISSYSHDISGLNGLEISSIRLRAVFKGSVDKTPILYSFGAQWKREDEWYDGFVGDSKILGAVATDNGTSALWRFDEESGQILPDVSPNGNIGLLGGGDNIEPGDPKWVDSKFGGGLRFDGKDDYVWVEKDESLKSDNTFSVEAWFKVDKIHGKPSSILGTRANGDYAIQITENRSIKAYLATIDNENNQYNELDSRSVIAVGRWCHVALVFNRPDILLYVNGVEEDRLTVDFSIRHSTVPLFLGAEVGSSHFPYEPANFFSGIIDEIRISRISRSAKELYHTARAGLSLSSGRAEIAPNTPALTTSTVLQYRFEKGTGRVVKDHSPNGILGSRKGGIISGTGIFENALELNGSGEYIKVRDSREMHLVNATYEFWLKYREAGSINYLFSEGTTGGAGSNEEGFIDESGHVHYTFDDKSYDISSTDIVPLDKWIHIACVRAGNTASIFINGSESGTGQFSRFVHNDTSPLIIGANKSGMRGFNGMMDDIHVLNEALSSQEIRSHAMRLKSKAAFRSVEMELPGRDPSGRIERIWDSFHMECNVPRDSQLNVSIHDNVTGEPLVEIIINSSSVSADLSLINAIEHPGIYIQANLGQNNTSSPEIFRWKVNWTEVRPPRLLENISELLSVAEDTKTKSLIDLSSHFFDTYSKISPPIYKVEFISDLSNITIAFNGSAMDVVALAENWTGTISIIVNCTNLYGRVSKSNLFNIVVVNVDDAPFWINQVPEIVLREDERIVLEEYLLQYVMDVENDTLDFEVECTNDNISVESGINGTLTVTGAKNYHGEGIIWATVSENEAAALNSTISISVSILPVNDPPEAVLITPGNNVTLTTTNLDFTWEVFDVDSDTQNITYDFYLSKTFPPLVYISDLQDNYITIDNLDDSSLYYWKVIPHDGLEKGTCLNGTHRFEINTTVLFPETELRYPLDGSIINLTSFNLSWTFHNPTDDTLYYRVYLGTSIDNMTEIALTQYTLLHIENLTNNETYFWKVIPLAGPMEGLCISGLWSFSINTSFKAVYNLSVSTAAHVTLQQGNNITFNLVLENEGNVPILAALRITGPLSSYVTMKENVFLAVGEILNVTVHLSNTWILESKDYEMVIIVNSTAGTENLGIIVTVLSASGSSDDQTRSGGGEVMWLWIAIAALCMIILCFIIFLIRKKKMDQHRKEEELELLEAEIVHPTLLPPPLPPMEPHPSLPPYPGNFGYGRAHEPQLGTQSYSPANGPAPKQLPQAAPAVPPPPGGPPLSAPAPSVFIPNMPRKDEQPKVLMKLPPAPISRVQVPRIFAPPQASPQAPAPAYQQSPVSQATSPPPVSSGSIPGAGQTPPSMASQPMPVPPEPPTAANPGTVAAPQGGVRDNLTQFLSEMPPTFQPKPPGQAPGQ